MSVKSLNVNIGSLKLKNPVIAASGTFGFGREYSRFIDLNNLGGISVKGLTLKPRKGNAPVRIAETPSGILNSVGLQNPGVECFIKNEIPFLRKYDTAIIVNIAGSTVYDYEQMAEILSCEDIDALEVNVSCPNVEKGCLAFGSNPEGVVQVTKAVRNKTKKPIIIKLTPNTSDIASCALAAQDSGADAVSLINTLLGMAIDIETKRPILANNYGGLSGPAVKPIAVRMVHQAYCSVKIPIIGMGGIMTGNDALEFIYAGASAVMVGTASFINPSACNDVLNGIIDYMTRHDINTIDEMCGGVQLWKN